MIKVFLAEDHKIVRDGIRFILENESGFSLVGEAENGQEATEKLKNTTVDVALIDLNMPYINGIQLTKHINDNYSNTKVLILSMLDHENYLAKAFEAGAVGYLPKSTGKDELISAINTVASGEIYISHKISLNLIKKPKNVAFLGQEGEKTEVEFSRREIEILNLVAEGFTNEEIAEKTFTSKRTVETHRKNLMEKTKTRNSASLIKFALKYGIIK